MSFGSRRGFPYTDDEGTVWALSLDESNTELVNDGADSLIPPTGAKGLPPEIKRRYVVLKSADGGTKKIPILTRALFDGLSLGDAFGAPAIGEENPALTSFVITQKVPERVLRAVVVLDTGKNDGDQP
jgi:hypothetical protein